MSVIDLRGNTLQIDTVEGAITGAITGNITGNVTGDVTGEVTGDVTGTLTGNQVMPSATVAGAGTVQGDAAAIAAGFTLVSGADATVGVKLPAAAAGVVCVVKNNAAAALKVWPDTDDAINAIAANGNFSMTNLTSCIFVAYDATTWYTVPLVAS